MFLVLLVYIPPISGAYTVVGLPSVVSVDIHPVAGVPVVFSIRTFPRVASASEKTYYDGTYWAL
jgi:hypothetical protein